MEAVALSVNRKPNKEFDLQMKEVLFWYERTIISLQFFINLIRRKYFRIEASMNTGSVGACTLQKISGKGTVTQCDLSPRFFCIDATLLCKFESDKI